MALSVYLIADVLFRAGVAALLAAAAVGFVAWMWFGWPIVIRRRYVADVGAASGDCPGRMPGTPLGPTGR